MYDELKINDREGWSHFSAAKNIFIKLNIFYEYMSISMMIFSWS